MTAVEFFVSKKLSGYLIDDKIEIIKLIVEFARLKCEEQRQIVGRELVSWSEDLSIPNQNKINELCEDSQCPEM